MSYGPRNLNAISAARIGHAKGDGFECRGQVHSLTLDSLVSLGQESLLCPSIFSVLDWKQSILEARAVWAGLLGRSLYFFRPLMESISDSFFETANHYEDLGIHGSRYAGVLARIALDFADVFPMNKLVDATQNLRKPGLLDVISTITQALESAGEQRANYWKHRVKPYLTQILPKSNDQITTDLSDRLATLSVSAKEVFPDAFNLMKEWITQLDDPYYTTLRLQENELCEHFPNEAFDFLTRVIGSNTKLVLTNLNDCLVIIGNSNKALKSDPRFNTLEERLHRIGHT